MHTGWNVVLQAGQPFWRVHTALLPHRSSASSAAAASASSADEPVQPELFGVMPTAGAEVEGGGGIGALMCAGVEQLGGGGWLLSVHLASSIGQKALQVGGKDFEQGFGFLTM